MDALAARWTDMGETNTAAKAIRVRPDTRRTLNSGKARVSPVLKKQNPRLSPGVEAQAGEPASG